MNLATFKQSINRAEERITTRRYGVCDALDAVGKVKPRYNWQSYASVEFNKMFKPRSRGHCTYWLGSLDSTNHIKRITYLRLFEQYVISEKLYKEW